MCIWSLPVQNPETSKQVMPSGSRVSPQEPLPFSPNNNRSVYLVLWFFSFPCSPWNLCLSSVSPSWILTIFAVALWEKKLNLYFFPLALTLGQTYSWEVQRFPKGYMDMDSWYPQLHMKCFPLVSSPISHFPIALTLLSHPVFLCRHVYECKNPWGT